MTETPTDAGVSGLDGAGASRASLDATMVETGGSGAVPERLVRGTEVGRYIILDELGAGGMGVVYAAYDPELDRKIAIKVLRSEGGDDASRLLREAQALARLSHPNVVAIHDVGQHDGRVFVAMDFVAGQNLRVWRKSRVTPSEVLSAYVQAGRGLAAAHRVGLVHRDFKPENAMMGEDGRVRVLDFGLARAHGSAAETRPDLDSVTTPEATHSTSRGSLEIAITRVGAAVGTPAYMAPEQHLGEAIDAQADQFSFCVSLYEALYRAAPFPGDHPAARAIAVIQGRVIEPSRVSGVDRRLWPVLRRGLEVDPRKRWPDMETLLAILERDPARTRRVWIAGGAALVAIGAAFAWGAATGGTGRGACVADPAALVGAWDPALQEKIRARFLATAVAYAPSTLERVEAGFQRWSSAWLETHLEACRGTWERHERSEELFDLQMECLDTQRRQASAVAAVLALADSEVVEHAAEAVASLPRPARCAEVKSLRSRPAPPTDPVTVAEVERLRGLMAHAKALESAGKYADAVAASAGILPAIDALSHGATQAVLWFQRGEILESAGQEVEAEGILRRAEHAAQLADDSRTLTQVRTLLGMVVGDRLSRIAEGHLWLDQAATAAQRVGADALLEGKIAYDRALVRSKEERLEEAIAELGHALERFSGDDAPSRLQAAAVHNMLAGELGDVGRHEEALRHADAAIQLWTSELGASHPKVAIGLATLALVHDFNGEPRKALPLHERAVALLEAATGPDSPRLAELLNNQAVTLADLGEAERSEEIFRRVLAIKRATYGEDHLEVASALGNLAGILRMRGRLEDSLEYDLRSLDLRRKHLPPRHPELAESLSGVANGLEQAGRHADGVNLRREAIEILEAAHGHDSPDLVVDLANLALGLTRSGRSGDAVAPARRARDLAVRGAVSPTVRAFAALALAHALVGSGGSATEARDLTEGALAELGDLPAEVERQLATELARRQRWKLAPKP